MTVSNDRFDPSAISITKGTTVTWTWSSDAVTHNVTFSDSNISGSDNLGAGATFSKTFPNAGTFSYHCTLHAGMSGTITVQ